MLYILARSTPATTIRVYVEPRGRAATERWRRRPVLFQRMSVSSDATAPWPPSAHMLTIARLPLGIAASSLTARTGNPVVRCAEGMTEPYAAAVGPKNQDIGVRAKMRRMKMSNPAGSRLRYPSV